MSDINAKDVDIVLLRRRRKMRRRLVKLTAFLFLVFVIFGLYVKRDVWFPKLEGIGNRYQSVKSSNGELAEGNFPLSISGGIDYQTSNLDGSLAILSDAYFYIYNLDGSLREERQHAYANAMFQTSGKKSIVYESGGNNFRVESKSKTVYTKKLEQNIIFARISSKGYAAVVTNSDTYVCRLTVYDDSGDEIYGRDCVERVTNITFNDDSTGCLISTSKAQNGAILSNIISVAFDSKKDKWTSDDFSAMELRTYYTSDGFFVLGDTKCAYYSSKGEFISEYIYPSSLVDFDFKGGKAAMLFSNEAKRFSYVTTLSGSDSDPKEREFADRNAKCIRIIGDHICLLTNDGLYQYNMSGEDEQKISSEGSYERFIFIDKYIFLLGYDRIDRIDYKD